jgi:hypothetical protein
VQTANGAEHQRQDGGPAAVLGGGGQQGGGGVRGQAQDAGDREAWQRGQQRPRRGRDGGDRHGESGVRHRQLGRGGRGVVGRAVAGSA